MGLGLQFIEVTKGAVQSTTSGDITVSLPSRKKVLGCIVRLASGTAAIGTISRVKVNAVKPSGGSALLMDVAGITLDEIGKELGFTAYTTNSTLHAWFIPNPKSKDKGINRQFGIPVDEDDKNKTPDHYRSATLTFTMSGATAAIFVFTFVCVDYEGQSKVCRLIQSGVSLEAKAKKFYPQNGAGEFQHWAHLWYLKSSAAVISTFKIGGDGGKEPFVFPYTQMAQLLTDFGFTPGSYWTYHWNPLLMGFDDYLDTLKDLKNPYVEITSDTEEVAEQVHQTIGDL